MKDITRYRIMRKFRSKHKIGDNLEYSCPDGYFDSGRGARCSQLCVNIWPELRNGRTYCPCTKWGCATALRKLGAWLRQEKARLGVTE